MLVTLSAYPFFLALLAAFLAEVSATLIRRVAATFGNWLYWLAGVLSAIAASCLIWSYLWALSLADANQRADTLLAVLGSGIVLVGGFFLVWALVALGAQTFVARPGSRLVKHGPYKHIRRPMGVAVALLGIGGATALGATPLWVWSAAWFLLSLPQFELEEWELRTRLPLGETYLEQTQRYLPRRTI